MVDWQLRKRYRSQFSRIRHNPRPHNPVIGLDPYRKLGERIKEARITQKKFQWQLAKATGICLEAVGHTERGERRLDVIEFWAIAHQLSGEDEDFAEFDRLMKKLLGVTIQTVEDQT